MMLPLALLLCVPQDSTPSDFDVRVVELATSSDGVEWFTVFEDASGVAVDLGSQQPHDLATVTAPAAEWHHVRVVLETQVLVQALDPCGSGQTVYHSIDLTGDPVHDPDGDGRWELHYATASGGGSVQGLGTLDDPAWLPDPIDPPKARDTRIRVLVETTGLVRCDDGVVEVDTPRIRVAADERPEPGTALFQQRLQVAGLQVDDAVGMPSVRTVQGILDFAEDGTWTLESASVRSSDFGTGSAGTEDPSAWQGLWGATSRGSVWLTLAGYDGVLTGSLGNFDEALALTAFGDDATRITLFGHRWPQSAPADPYIPPTRFLHYGAHLELFSEAPLDGDLVWRNAWGRMSGSGGWVGFDGQVQVNELRILSCFDPAPHQVVVDSDPVPFPQGAPFSVLTTGGELDLDLLDWQLPLHGSVIEDGRLTLSAPASDVTGSTHGLTVTVAIPWSVTGSPLAGRTLSGTYLGDTANGAGTQSHSGRFDVEFAADGTATWRQQEAGSSTLETTTLTGTWSMDSEAIVTVDLPGVGRYRGQLSETPRLLALCSSPDGTGGSNDRFLGLLLWP